MGTSPVTDVLMRMGKKLGELETDLEILGDCVRQTKWAACIEAGDAIEKMRQGHQEALRALRIIEEFH